MVSEQEISSHQYAYEAYLEAFRVGELYTRYDFVEANGVPYTTVTYNLERAVKDGKLHRQKRIVGRSPMWVYGLPETLPKVGL